MPDYQLVDLTVDDGPIRAVGAEPLIGVDTEFMRERTFFAELCLLQIATRDRIFCADPIGADGDGAPADDLWQAIMHAEWVLHSGRQDFEVIYQAAGRLPDSVFDTQVAAALLGFQPQIGYAGLVKELFDIELAKSHTRADWSKRPIADALLNYAAEDVQFLLPARDALLERLEQAGRLDWALQDSQDLLDVALYQTNPGAAIQRLKGARNLRGRARAAAAALAAWREQQAISSNRPRQWILRDPVLVDLAMRAPDSKSALARIDGLPEKVIRRAGDELLGIIRHATDDASGYQPPARPDESQKVALQKMQQYVAVVADDIGIASELIAPKKELSAAMLGQRQLRVFTGWRGDLVGEELLGLLEH